VNKDIMVDLETLGTKPGSVVLSIGAVEFSPETGELGREFYAVINQQASLNIGLTKDPETVAWWKKQSLEAQKVLYATFEDNGDQPTVALAAFNTFLAPCGKDVRIWGNGSDFDQPILVAVYAALKLSAPWLFWNNRCYRTLKSLHPEIPFRREGTYHNALDDAKSQATHALEIFKSLTS
jgi:hypothetical protein